MKIRLKKISALLLCMAVMTSCTQRDSTTNKYLYIQALGIDDDNGKISCTTQVFDPDLGQATIQEQDESITRVVESSGDSIAQAVFNISDQLGKKPFYSQNKLIVIGQSIAQSGIRPYMDYFDRDWETRLGMQVVVGTPDANSVVGAEMEDSINPAQDIALCAKSGSINGEIPECTLLDVKRSLVNEYEGFCVPVVEISKEDDKSKILIESIAVFDNDSICTYIDTEQARGVMYINDEISGGLEVIDAEDFGKISLEITSSDTNKKAYIENGRIICDIDVKCSAAITEIGSESENINITDNLDKIEMLLERQIAGRMQEAENIILKQYGCDVFAFNRQLRCDKKNWSNICFDWKNNLKKAKINYNVKASITGIGENAG